MREIKYRGIVEGSMWHASPESDEWEQFWVLADKETIGQYTGLKDSSGKEIYEGDILKSHKHNFIGVVAWDTTGYACFRVYEIKGDNREDSVWSCVDHMLEYEVIGNIHENPELLEPKTAKT